MLQQIRRVRVLCVSACKSVHCVTKLRKTLDWKREFNVAVWRHKQRTASNNDHRTPLAGADLPLG